MSRFKLPQRLTGRFPRNSRRAVSQGTDETDRRDFEALAGRYESEVETRPVRELAEAGDGEPARRRLPSRRTAEQAVAAVIGVLLIVALLWIAGELHYQSCIQAAQARTSAPTTGQGQLPPKIDNAIDRALGRAPTESRGEAVRGCSRLPF